MENKPTWISVVALALRDRFGRVLLQKRPIAKHHGGLWEFPGGKVEPGENPREALRREIAEELAIGIETTSLVPGHMADQTGDVPVVLFLYSCQAWSGDIVAAEGQDWGWFSLETARSLPMPPMDADLLARITD